jgi:hypothetical protein
MPVPRGILLLRESDDLHRGPRSAPPVRWRQPFLNKPYRCTAGANTHAAIPAISHAAPGEVLTLVVKK